MMIVEDRVELKDGSKMAYRIEGDLSDPIIMMANGAVFSYHQFLAEYLPWLKRFLGDGYCYVLYDYIGYGRSSDIDTQFDFEVMADQQLELMDQLKIEKAHLYGFSKGSVISHIITAKYPERVLSLGVFGSPNPANNYARERVKAYYQRRLDGLYVMEDKFDQNIDDELYDEVFDKIYIPSMFEVEKDEMNIIHKISAWYVRRVLKPFVVGPKLGMMVKLFKSFLQDIEEERKEFYIELMKSIEAPVLHMHGKADPFIPYSSSVLLSEWIDNSVLHLFKTFKHNRPSLTPWQARAIMKKYSKFVRSLNGI